MTKHLLLAVFIFFTIPRLQAQQGPIDELLQTIANNNPALANYRAQNQSRLLAYKLENRLPDLQASAYYMPYGVHNTGVYTEYEVSQTFEFPTVYRARKRWINEQRDKLDFEYLLLKQKTLLEAKQLALQLISLGKQQEISLQRMKQYQQVIKKDESLTEAKNKPSLQRNKATVTMLDLQFELDELEQQMESTRQQLQSLNGGKDLSFGVSSYPSLQSVENADSLWSEWMALNAEVALIEQQKLLAEKELKIKRNQLFPDLTAGYNYQGVQGNDYAGFYGGLSIPLWNAGTEVKQAEMQVELQEQAQEESLNTLKLQFLNKVHRYQMLLKKLRQYENVLFGMNEDLILRESGLNENASFAEYYDALSFYYEAQDRILEIEKELQLLNAELFMHRL